MMSQPLVSVIIPAFNAQNYISETIDSIIAQSYTNIEIIVVDDGSTDNTAEIIKSYNNIVKYVYQNNSGGCSVPRNTGISVCKGELLTFIDSDDLMPPNRVESQVSFLCNHLDIDLVFSDYQNFGLHGKSSSTHFQECPNFHKFLDGKNEIIIDRACEYLADENFGISGTFMLRRRLLNHVSGFNTALKACEDFHFYYQLARFTRVGVINQVGMLRRLHDNNMTKSEYKMFSEGIKCYKMLIDSEHNNIAKDHLKRNLAIRWRALGRYFTNNGKYMKALSSEIKGFASDVRIKSMFSLLTGVARAVAVAAKLHIPSDK